MVFKWAIEHAERRPVPRAFGGKMHKPTSSQNPSSLFSANANIYAQSVSVSNSDIDEVAKALDGGGSGVRDRAIRRAAHALEKRKVPPMNTTDKKTLTAKYVRYIEQQLNGLGFNRGVDAIILKLLPKDGDDPYSKSSFNSCMIDRFMTPC